MSRDSSLFSMPSSQELCTTIFDSLPVGVIVANLDGTNLFVNRCAASMTGYSVHELMGGIWLVHPDDTEASPILNRALRDGTPGGNYETRLVRKDGSAFWASISWNPAKDSSGTLTGLCTVLTDISERRDTQHALKDASERYRMLADHGSDIFSEWNIEGNVVHVSDSIRQLGYAPTDLVGRNVFGLVPAEDRATSEERLRTLLSDSQSLRHELRVLARDGSIRWLEAQVDLVRENGEPMRIYAVHRDITERKAAEEELRQVNERFRAMAENSGDTFWEMTPDGTFTYVSSGLRRIGYEPDEWVGHKLADFLPPDEVPILAERLQNGVPDQQPALHEFRIQNKDGSDIWVEVMVNYVVSEGKVLRLHGIARNITERKSAEAALRESEERFRNLSFITTEGIMIDEGGVILDANKAFANLVGLSDPAELVGKRSSEVVRLTPESVELVRENSRSRTADAYDIELIGRDGRTIPAETSARDIIYQGRTVRLVSLRDVTERKRMKEELRSVAQIPEEIPSPVLRLARDNHVLYANRAARELLAAQGWEPDKVAPVALSKPAKELPKPGHYAEFEFIHQGRTISFFCVPVSDKEYVNLYGRDITERMAAEEELRLVNERYRQLAENASDLLWTLDLDGVITYVSPAVRQLGYEPEDWIGHHPFEFIFPEEYEPFTERMSAEVIANVRPEAHPLHMHCKDGSSAWLEVVRDVIKTDGVPVGIQGMARVITDRVATEEALRESEARYKSIVESSRDLIMLNRPDGTIVYASPALRDILGYEQEELVGTMPHVVHPEDTDEVRAAFARAAIGEGGSNFEYRLISKTGETVWVSHSWSPVLDGVSVQTIASVVRDITERKTSEEELRRAHEELEQAYKLQREFLNNVTHEVRTPLTAVQGYTEMLMEGVAGPVSEEQAALLQKVVNSSEHLLDVLNGVLQTARMKSGRIDLRPRVSDPRLIIEKCISVVLPQARKKGLSINVKPDPHGTVATYDEEKLTIVLTNLLGNAVKFTAAGSIDVAVTALLEGCEIIVVDTGLGIDDLALAGIFDEFSQLDYPGKHKPSGFGLGLAIVAAMVDAIGGSLTVSSKKGLGTAFALWAPALEV